MLHPVDNAPPTLDALPDWELREDNLYSSIDGGVTDTNDATYGESNVNSDDEGLGVTYSLPIDERHNYSKEYLEIMLSHLLGGRVAEKLVMNELTTGAGNDIERATDLARKMVCEWGMSEKLGPLAYGKNEEELFLGREVTKHTDYSEKTAQEMVALHKLCKQINKTLSLFRIGYPFLKTPAQIVDQ